MRITGFDVFAFAAGGIAVVFSGFVLFYSTVGGLALAGGGVLAVSLPFLRESADSGALDAVGWLAVFALFAAGVGGFLVGVGVFDEPDPRWEANATLYDVDGDRSAVVVTGTVANDGDAAADGVTVTATLVDADGAELRAETKRLPRLPPDATAMFYFRFDGGEELRRFEDAEIDVVWG